jgi:hypothetical protein
VCLFRLVAGMDVPSRAEFHWSEKTSTSPQRRRHGVTVRQGDTRGSPALGTRLIFPSRRPGIRVQRNRAPGEPADASRAEGGRVHAHACL